MITHLVNWCDDKSEYTEVYNVMRQPGPIINDMICHELQCNVMHALRMLFIPFTGFENITRRRKILF